MSRLSVNTQLLLQQGALTAILIIANKVYALPNNITQSLRRVEDIAMATNEDLNKCVVTMCVLLSEQVKSLIE